MQETFQLVLLSADSDDGAGSTPQSGASINTDSSRVMISIQENDLPYGLLQFSQSGEMRPEDVIAPATQIPVVSVGSSFMGPVTV